MKATNIAFCNSNDKAYQQKLNPLLKDIFLDFQFWYDLNLWDDKYESYAIMEADEIVSNICVFKTELIFNGEKHQALSIGAVATKESHRGRGLSGILMQHILEKYEGVPMYLAANEGVVDFYPKFGFRRVYEKLPVAFVSVENTHLAHKLCFNDPKVADYIYKKIQFSEKLDCLNTQSVQLFHVHFGYLKESIYELPEIETMIIAEQEEQTLKLMGVYSKRPVTFEQLLKHLPFTQVQKIEFGFMPYWSDCAYEMMETETDPLFVRGIGCDLGDFKFPELSIT